MTIAEIITIGTELLLGEITDTNSQYLARALNDNGFDVFRVSTVGDNITRIADILKEASQRSDLVITTGGLGPTVDDPTRNAAALACGVQTIFHEELWQQITQRFQQFHRSPSENNKRQAYLPQNATAIENRVGTAPAFSFLLNRSLVCCLPGVPSEMRYLFEHEIVPLLNDRMPNRAVLITTIVHTIGIGESTIDEMIGDLEKMPNPTIGLAAHTGSVDIRISAKAANQEKAHRMIEPILEIIQEKLGPSIYGYDQESIQDAIIQQLFDQNLNLEINAQDRISLFNELEKGIQQKLENKRGKNQYNNRKSQILRIAIRVDDRHEKKTLFLDMELAGEPTHYEYHFMNDPSIFTEWLTNRTLGTIFSYLQRKG